MKLSKRAQGFLWIFLSVGLLVWSILSYSSILVACCALSLLYGVMCLVQSSMVERRMVLNAGELDQFGARLTDATPAIIAALEQGSTPGEIAEQMSKIHQLPAEITLKYIIALGRYQSR